MKQGCTEDLEICGATANILFARATWRPGFVHRCKHRQGDQQVFVHLMITIKKKSA
jgi:hypothetical protein